MGKKRKPSKDQASPSPEKTAAPSRRPGWLEFAWQDLAVGAGLGVLIVALFKWSWLKWADLYIDFGRELYQPWRILAGEILYRDLALDYGPLSKHVCALWFGLFGVSFQTLVWSNLFLFCAFVALLYLFLRGLFDRWTAAVALGLFAATLGFSQYVGIANYNYIAPYSHESVHGLMLSWLMLVCLWRTHENSRYRRRALLWCAGAGFCLGAVFLTKPDIFLAAGMGAGVMFAGALVVRTHGLRDLPGLGATFAAGMLVLPAAFFAWFSAHMSQRLAFEALCGAWRPFFQSSEGFSESAFTLGNMGMDAPLQNLLAVAAGFGVWAGVLFGVLLALMILARLMPSGKREEKDAFPTHLIPAALLAVAAYVVARQWDWLHAFRPLPALVGAGIALAASLAWKDRRAWTESGPRWVAILAVGVFAGASLAKMLLNARVYHYGFTLAMPALVFVAAVIHGLIPKLLPTSRLQPAIVWRWTLGGLMLACAANLLAVSNRFYAVKQAPVGEGRDRFLTYLPQADGRTPFLQKVLEWSTQNVPPDAELLVVPEGQMLNYLLRKRSPCRLATFEEFIPEVWGGTDRLLADLSEKPPQFVYLVQRDYSERNVGPWGVDPRNGKKIREWIDANYNQIFRAGANPLEGTGFGILGFRLAPKALPADPPGH